MTLRERAEARARTAEEMRHWATAQVIRDLLSALAATERTEKWQPTHTHYKGGSYRFLMLATRESDLQTQVVYEDELGDRYVRPLKEFEKKFTTIAGLGEKGNE